MAHVFLGVDLSDDDRHAVAARLKDLDLSRLVPGKRTRPANWHVTLVFIGEAADEAIDRIAERTEAHLADGPFRVRLTGIGGFPRPSKASVAFIGVDDPSEGLASLGASCRAAVEDVGIDIDGRPFVPHVTLSRIRPPQSILKLTEVDELGVSIDVRAVTLFRTVPGRDGVSYEVIDRFGLVRS